MVKVRLQSHALRAGLKFPIGTCAAGPKIYIPSQQLDAIASPGHMPGSDLKGNQTMTVINRVAGAYVVTAAVVGLLAMVV